MNRVFSKLALGAGTILLCLLIGCMSPAHAATPIPLTTPAGVCEFQATKVTAVGGAFAAQGEWGPGCPGYVSPVRQPPAGNCTATAGLTRNTSLTRFDQVWGAFPGKSGIKTFQIPRGQYIALEFTVPATMTPQTIGKFSNLSTGTSASFSTTITSCPGDFSTAPVRCALSANSEGNLPFVINYAGGNRCPLLTGGTYYLNIVHRPIGASAVTSCAVASCSATIKNAPGQ